MTARQRLSTKARAQLFERHEGRCHLCLGKIMAGEAWEVSHPIPLAAGGEDEDGNRAPAHKKCHARQTAETDAPLIAKTRRMHQKHIGAYRSAHPMNGGKRSKWRKKVSGEVVERRQ
jgi:5-methylcytosine-specific restriction protein A